MSSTLRGALVGSGYASSFQLAAWARIKEVKIVAVASRTEKKAAKRASEFGIPATYSDYRLMLDQERPDFLDIATPPAAHLEMVREAARRRCALLCQKPIALTLGDLHEMVALCEHAGILFMVNENGRFQPWFRRMKELLNQGAVGQPFYANLTARARFTLPPASSHPQWGLFADMPRLLVYELGVHFLDTLRFLHGEARMVQARLNRISPHVAGEDQAVLLLDFAGIVAVVDLSWAAVPAWPDRERITWGEYRVEGTAGTLHLRPDGLLRVLTDAGETSEPFPRDAILLGYQGAQQHFVDCLLGGEEPETSGRETLKTMELVFGTYDSAENDRIYRVGRDVERLEKCRSRLP